MPRLWIGFSVLAASLFILSCAQDPIFFNISLEPAPRTSIMRGSGGSMVIAGTGAESRIFASTHRGRDIWVFNYPVPGGWHRMESSPGGPFGGLAVIGDDLFAVVYGSGSPPSSRIMRYNMVSETWSIFREVPDHVILNLYSAGGRLFAGAQRRSNLLYYILRFNPDPTNALPYSSPLDAATEFVLQGRDIGDVLTGVAEGPLGGAASIYLATGRNGVLTLASADATAHSTISLGNIIVTSGLFRTGDDIVVVGRESDRGGIRIIRGGSLDSSFSLTLGGNQFFTGGMGVWHQHNGTRWDPAVLLLGIWTHNRNVNGYREIALTPDGDIDTASILRIPGDQIEASSVNSRARYNASIGTRAVQAILQVPPDMLLSSRHTPPPVPGWSPPIFAATSRDGLWVYNPVNDEWNAEDNSQSWLPSNIPPPQYPCLCSGSYPCTCAPNECEDTCLCPDTCPCPDPAP